MWLVPCHRSPVPQMLDVTVSQLLSLQPSLAARVSPKHRDVKESWARLQQALRWGSPRPGCSWL